MIVQRYNEVSKLQNKTRFILFSNAPFFGLFCENLRFLAYFLATFK